MKLADLIELMDERQNINDYADFELLSAEGVSVTSITIDEREGLIYLGNEYEFEKGFQKVTVL